MSNTSHYEADERAEQLVRRLQAVRRKGGWLPWMAFILALTWWGGASAYAVGWIGLESIRAAPPLIVASAILLAFTPGLLIWVSGFMAREHTRASAANAIVLESAQILLSPASRAGENISSIGELIRSETSAIDETMAKAQHSLNDLTSALKRDRSLLEQSIETNRSQIAHLVERLSTERQALADLSIALKEHSDSVTDAIPRQAKIMADAARLAQQELAQSDEALDNRLAALDEAGRALADRLNALDRLAEDATGRTKKLTTTLNSMEEKLSAATSTVESAAKAGELASLAASETAESLHAAVANSLDGTREAAVFIREETNRATEDIHDAMAKLKDAGDQAEASMKAAGIAAKANANDIEDRMHQLSELLYRSANRATETAEAGLERARVRIERAADLLNQRNGDGSNGTVFPELSDDDGPLIPPPLDRSEIRTDADAAPRIVRGGENGSSNGKSAPAADDAEFMDAFRDATGTNGDNGNLSWRDLLSAVDDPTGSRDQDAKLIIDRLSDTSIRFPDTFRSRDAKRIASAAKKGDLIRRRAIKDAAPKQVTELIDVLDEDDELRTLAQRFLVIEETDALKALAAANSGRSPSLSPRLSAFLLIDAAIG